VHCTGCFISQHLKVKDMNALTEINQGGGRMAVSDIISHVAVVQEVMRAVMKENVHFGKIPGTDKPTLYKAGAEVLSMVFRIADTYEVTDLSTDGIVRYRVNCIGTHQTTGIVLGSGLGEASSGEEKYKWRKAVSEEEFNETPANMRRIKHGKNYKANQIRTEPADLANTILKMANKRAKMAMVLNVTAASDCFSQDLEDMDDAMRDHLTRHGEEGAPAGAGAKKLAFYTDEQFEANIPIWTKVIAAKKKDVAGVLATIATLFSLTPEQEARVKAIPADIVKNASERKPERTGPASGPNESEILRMIEKANNIDDLNAAGDLVNSITDSTSKDRLNGAYDERARELE
jgi:mono/diheme cytochrome c family protein